MPVSDVGLALAKRQFAAPPRRHWREPIMGGRLEIKPPAVVQHVHRDVEYPAFLPFAGPEGEGRPASDGRRLPRPAARFGLQARAIDCRDNESDWPPFSPRHCSPSSMNRHSVRLSGSRCADKSIDCLADTVSSFLHLFGFFRGTLPANLRPSVGTPPHPPCRTFRLVF